MKLEVARERSKGRRERRERSRGAFAHKRKGAASRVNCGFPPGVTNPADGGKADGVVLGPPKSRTHPPRVGPVRLAGDAL